jgi:DNA-directed RNA polymerase specialized sigma24 family protein
MVSIDDDPWEDDQGDIRGDIEGAVDDLDEDGPDDWERIGEGLSRMYWRITEVEDLLRQLRADRAETMELVHDAGMSLREIGAAFGMSHTAVRKIIAGA